jgi:hypothetical protein
METKDTRCDIILFIFIYTHCYYVAELFCIL